MPRKLNVQSLNVGSGAQVLPPQVNLLASPPGSLPLVEAAPQVSPKGGASAGLRSHIRDVRNAHSASAIQHDGAPSTLISETVEGALDELIGVLPPEPPCIGQAVRYTTFSGIPDWGALKLQDATLSSKVVFPYYHVSPSPALGSEFPTPGRDPRTDHVWNSGTGVALLGGGLGEAHIGGFTRNGDSGVAPLKVVRTARMMARSAGTDITTGKPYRQAVTISGAVYPADRGVLAILHFPPSLAGDSMVEFRSQSLLDRCVAALLLGGGLRGDACITDGQAGHHVCDGQPGGIFSLGEKDEKYNPYAFPGRASGQFDLLEIHQGSDGLSNQALAAPWNDLDDDGVAGDKRNAVDTIPAAGQVRLGTDPDSGIAPVNYGIPILGGTEAAFSVPPSPIDGSLSKAIHGQSLLLSSNFFRYRLPVLKDYARLRWTPRGEDALATQETHRFFAKAEPFAALQEDGSALPIPASVLATAGHYGQPFEQDYWTWQIARYRHTFLMPSTQGVGLRQEVGSYWLIHFKTEKDFEKLVRDGIPPWDVTNGYAVFGASLVDTDGPEETGNLANEFTGVVPVAPLGKAPAYGYKAASYHQLRSAVLLDPLPASFPAATMSKYTWTTAAAPATPAVMYCSGVAYFTPRIITNGNSSFTLTGLTVTLGAGFWKAAYRTDDSVLTLDANAPALVSSPNPAFLGLAPFAYGQNFIAGSDLSASVTVNVNPTLGLTETALDLRRQRVEFPFTHMGSTATGVYSLANGPLDANTVAILQPAAASLVLQGDHAEPAFVQDARVRMFFRRPLHHTRTHWDAAEAVLPVSVDAGHGVEVSPTTVGTILFHSTRFDIINKIGAFGNFVSGAAAPFVAYPELFGYTKDTKERFLDETYRYDLNFAGLSGLGTYDAAAQTALVGPGMSTWAGGGIEIPVRAGLAQEAAWAGSAWLRQETHKVSLLAAGVVSPLQVGGLPHRNPLLTAEASVPFPSAGLLSYPQKNYSVGHVPVVGTHLAVAQPNYVGATGIRTYLRAFDVAFSKWPAAVPPAPSGMGPRLDVVGQTFVVLRLDGITLGDFAHVAPGPGRLNNNALAIFVKVPGLTTWMDAGCPDGAGPSKQDAGLDGAGCLVHGPETYNFVDSVTGYRGCYIKVHTGAFAPLFFNLGVVATYPAAGGVALGEVPLLVKVQMRETALKYNLEYPVSGAGFAAATSVGAAPKDVRGLFGISVVHPNETLLLPA